MKKKVLSILTPSPAKRLSFFFMTDVLALAATLYLSFQLRFDFAMDAERWRVFLYALPFFIVAKLFVFGSFRVYRMTWRYVGLEDMLRILSAVAVAELVLMVIMLLLLPEMPGLSRRLHPGAPTLPRSIFLIDGALSILFFSGLRISKRVVLDILHKNLKRRNCRKTLIIGAGDTGEMILRDILRQKRPEFCPVGFIDNDRNKIGCSIHGLRVLSGMESLKEVITVHKVELVIIAIPTLGRKELKAIFDTARELVDSIKIVPRIYDFHQPTINLKSLEEIKIEDLIGRQAVEIDRESVTRFIRKKVVLVTGAGGSIGSEIVRQVAAYQPERVVLFDIDETELHNMEMALRRAYPRYFRARKNVPGVAAMNTPEKFAFVVGDVRNRERVNAVMRAYRPDIVYHAAAYKHVPMMESNPEEAVRVNMFGTYEMASAAVAHVVKKFVMISSDKAVRPTSVMGATKRMAENICRSFGGGDTSFVSVRFGNVLGSRGSVLPLFMDQLRAGGPLTVTDKEVKRYFMTIPEATSLVLQASVIGRCGEILVLDMGKPVRIAELAEELIRLNGLEPYRDIDIEFVGLRPGEKLYEEIFTNEEIQGASAHEKIFMARNTRRHQLGEIERILGEFEDGMEMDGSGETLRMLLRKYVEHMAEGKGHLRPASSQGGIY